MNSCFFRAVTISLIAPWIIYAGETGDPIEDQIKRELGTVVLLCVVGAGASVIIPVVVISGKRKAHINQLNTLYAEAERLSQNGIYNEAIKVYLSFREQYDLKKASRFGNKELNNKYIYADKQIRKLRLLVGD